MTRGPQSLTRAATSSSMVIQMMVGRNYVDLVGRVVERGSVKTAEFITIIAQQGVKRETNNKVV